MQNSERLETHVHVLLGQLAAKLLVQQDELGRAGKKIQGGHLAGPLCPSQCHHPFQASHTLLANLACTPIVVVKCLLSLHHPSLLASPSQGSSSSSSSTIKARLELWAGHMMRQSLTCAMHTHVSAPPDTPCKSFVHGCASAELESSSRLLTQPLYSALSSTSTLIGPSLPGMH